MDALVIIFWLLILLGGVGIYLSLTWSEAGAIVPTRVKLRMHPMAGPFVVGQQVIVKFQPTKAGNPLSPSTLSNPTWGLGSSAGAIPPQEHSTDGNEVAYVFSDVGAAVFVTFAGTNQLGQVLNAATEAFDIVPAPADDTIPDAVTLTLTSPPFVPGGSPSP